MDQVRESAVSEAKKSLSAVSRDQIILALPALLYILSPVVDMIIDFVNTLRGLAYWEAFSFIPALPKFIAVILAAELVAQIAHDRSAKPLFKAGLKRTATFQTTLILFILYLGLVLMSIGVNGFTYYAVNGHPYTQMGMWTYITNVLLYMFTASLIYDERVKKFLATVCCYGGAAYALYSIVQYRTQIYSGSLRGTYYNSNHYGYYLAVSIALTACMINEKFKLIKAEENTVIGKKGGEGVVDLVIWSVLMFVQCIALGYNNTLGAWLAVLFAIVFIIIVGIVKEKKFEHGALIPLGIFMLSSFICSFLTVSIMASLAKTVSDVGEIAQGTEASDHAGSGRWLLWKLTVKHILDRPIFGNGIEGLLEIITLEGANTGSPHNEYLEYAAFFGIPCAAVYIAALVSVFIHAVKYKSELNPITVVCLTGGFAYLVSAFFGVCFYYTVTYPFIFLGLSLNFTKRDRPEEAVKIDEASAESEAETNEEEREDTRE